MRYKVNCFAQEDWTDGMTDLTAREALDYAYSFVETHPFGAAHIIAVDTLSGIYIARPTDLRTSNDTERMRALLAVKWA